MIKWRQVSLFFTNGINQFLPAVCELLLSFLIIRLGGISLWGSFVSLLLIPSLALQVVAWGNKEYLLRTFAQKPREITLHWQTSLIARLPVFCLMAVIYWFIPTDSGYRGWVINWALGQFFYQSFQVFIVYKRAFTPFLLLELISFVLTAVSIWYARESLSLGWLLQTACVINWLKVGAACVLFNREVIPRLRIELNSSHELLFLRKSFPFLLIGLGGTLAFHMDVYAVKYLLSDRELGQYYLFTTALMQAQNVSGVITQPFAKNRFQLSTISVRQLEGLFIKIGLTLPIPLLLGVYGLLWYYYRMIFSLDFYLIGYLYVVPVFLYTNLVYGIFRQNRQNVVILTLLVGCLLNLGGCLVLIPWLGMKGALVSGMAMQWFILGTFVYREKIGGSPKRRQFSSV